jgi:hypothetical protein
VPGAKHIVIPPVVVRRGNELIPYDAFIQEALLILEKHLIFARIDRQAFRAAPVRFALRETPRRNPISHRAICARHATRQQDIEDGFETLKIRILRNSHLLGSMPDASQIRAQ